MVELTVRVDLAVEGMAWISRWRSYSVGLVVEELRHGLDLSGEDLTAWVSWWRGRWRGSLGGGADGVIWLFWMIFGWF